MPDPNDQRPVSPQLKRLQTPEQQATRNFLRKVGPLVFGAGLICVIIGMVDFFMAMSSRGEPRLFWLLFVGMPLMFVGGVMSQFGFLGAVTRYVAGEGAPVAADTANYLADETKGAVETVAKSAAKGIAEGIEAGRGASETNFCPHCGTGVKADFKFCPKCGKVLANA
jgi:hypothetical protein